MLGVLFCCWETRYTFSGDCQTGSDTSPSSIDLATCNITCGVGLVTDAGAGGQLGVCNASGWVEINASACLEQCSFPPWTISTRGSSTPFNTSDAENTTCSSAVAGGFDRTTDCPVSCSTSHYSLTCPGGTDSFGECTVDLTALRDGDSDETAQAQCTALESTATYTSITGECSYDPTADEYITIPSVFATAAMMETDAGALTQASCAALCAATSGCTAAFHVQELRCFDGFFSCICSSNNDQCWLTTASQGLVPVSYTHLTLPTNREV